MTANDWHYTIKHAIKLTLMVGVTAGALSPQGQLLLSLGKSGMPGSAAGFLDGPSGVAPNGDVYVADGHGGNTNDRIVKFGQGRQIHHGVGQARQGGPRIRHPSRHRT